MLGMFVLVLLSFAVANVQSFLWTNSKWLVSTVLPAVVISETNEARAGEDLPPLAPNDVLDRAAQMKAEDMAAKGYFAHESPEGLTPWYWFKEAGYAYAYAGENLAVHFTDSTAVVDAWLKSPAHRANVMNGNYTEIGIGTAKGTYEGVDTVFVVQLFGTPAAAVVTPATPEAEVAQRAQISPSLVPVTEVETQEVSVEEPVETASMTDAGTVVYESYMATETPGAVLAANTEEQAVHTEVSFFRRLMTSPNTLLQIAYSIIGLFVMGLLFYTLIFEWKHHHPIQTAYSVGLLAVMMGLFWFHAAVTGGIIT
jgi:hypothetical protein